MNTNAAPKPTYTMRKTSSTCLMCGQVTIKRLSPAKGFSRPSMYLFCTTCSQWTTPGLVKP